MSPLGIQIEHGRAGSFNESAAEKSKPYRKVKVKSDRGQENKGQKAKEHRIWDVRGQIVNPGVTHVHGDVVLVGQGVRHRLDVLVLRDDSLGHLVKRRLCECA